MTSADLAFRNGSCSGSRFGVEDETAVRAGVAWRSLTLGVMEAIDHLDLVVTSLERSLAFYRGLLGPLGYVHVGEIEGERGERVDDTPGYYALCVHDPDGLKLVIVHRPRERELILRVQELESRLRQPESGSGLTAAES